MAAEVSLRMWMAKKSAPKRRRGLSAIANGLQSAAAKHRMKKAKTEEKFRT
jgi:hypothetical protein